MRRTGLQLLVLYTMIGHWWTQNTDVNILYVMNNVFFIAFHCRVETFHELMVRLSSKVDNYGTKNIINVDRQDVLDGAFRGFQRSSFNAKAQLNVRFSGEDGIDTGGLTREFLRLAVRAIESLSIFSDSTIPNSKLLTMDYKGLS